MKTCPRPGCSEPLEGLGTFCHSCGQYTDSEKEAVGNNAVGAYRAEADFTEGIIKLPLPPSANAAWRSVVGAKKFQLFEAVDAYREAGGGKAAWRAILAAMFVNVTISEPYRTYKADLETWLAAQTTEVLEGDVDLECRVYFENRRRDLDGVIKVLLDVLQGVLYGNDRQIHRLVFVKLYDKTNPRVEVEVKRMAPELFTAEEIRRSADLEF